MQIQLEKQKAQPIDDATRAAIAEARAEAARGEFFTLKQSNIIIRKQHQAWRKTQQETLAT